MEESGWRRARKTKQCRKEQNISERCLQQRLWWRPLVTMVSMECSDWTIWKFNRCGWSASVTSSDECSFVGLKLQWSTRRWECGRRIGTMIYGGGCVSFDAATQGKTRSVRCGMELKGRSTWMNEEMGLTLRLRLGRLRRNKKYRQNVFLFWSEG